MKDLLLDADFDLKIKNGDLVTGDCERQEIDMILRLVPGELKSYPALGCDLLNLINDETQNLNTIKNVIKSHLKYDNKELEKIEINNGKLTVYTKQA